MERGICPIAMLALRLTRYSLTESRVWHLGSSDVIGDVTIGTAYGPLVLVVCWRQVTISHGCRDIEPQTFWSHDLDPFGSRNVIGHVTIGTAHVNETTFISACLPFLSCISAMRYSIAPHTSQSVWHVDLMHLLLFN